MNPEVSRITFIYGLFDPQTGQCRYVGKSDMPYQRLAHHRIEKSDTHKGRWLRLLREAGLQPLLRIFEVAPLDQWGLREQHWIDTMKAAGAPLTNSCEGGRGLPTPSETTRQKMRAAKVGRPLTAEHKQKVSAALKGKPKPPRTAEHIAKIAKARTGQPLSDEACARLLNLQKVRPGTSASGFKGVSYDKARGKFKAHITVNKKMKFIGRYETAEAAARAYNTAASALGWPQEGLNPV